MFFQVLFRPIFGILVKLVCDIAVDRLSIAVRREIVEHRLADLRRLMGAYAAARAWGNAHRDAVIDAAMAYRPRDRDFYETYYMTLKYELTAEARKGLARFGVELANLEDSHVAR